MDNNTRNIIEPIEGSDVTHRMMESNEQTAVRKSETDPQNSGADSSSSSNGRGSGSGGYNADCSSSDASSDTSLKRKNDILNTSLDKSNEVQKNADTMANAGVLADDRTKPSTSEKRSSPQGCDAVSTTACGRMTNNVTSKMGALDALLEQGRKMKEEPLLQDQMMILPQLNGVRISHPMDPRIDLSTVGHLPGEEVPVATNGGQSQVLNLVLQPPPQVSQPPAPSIDNYLNLMEAVRPYFMSHGMPTVHHMPNSHEAGQMEKEGSDENQDGTPSSEGFTAFFTTTSDSNSNSDGKSNKKSNSQTMDGNTKPSELSPQDERTNEERPRDERTSGEKPLSHAEDVADDSDNSSMVVLVRVKRKHLRKQQAEGQGDETNLSGGDEAKGLNFQDNQHHNEENRNKRSQQGMDIQHENASMGQRHEKSSTSSSEGNEPIMLQGQHEAHQQQGIQDNGQGQIRIVSEVSSTTNTANNTSGSGSGGNSGTNSGSGSNQNSSGSGNENQASSGSGNDGHVRDDKCAGERNAVQVDNGRVKSRMEADEAEMVDSRKAPPSQEDDEASREQKLLDKKRKRMNMRREYEEQVQQELGSESSNDTLVLRPGKPVTLDAVLSFSKNARIVVQATPPFVVVHANAAYSGLTGIHCHSIIGKPIRDVLQVPESKDLFNLTEINNADGSHSGQSSMTNSANAPSKQTQNGASRSSELNHAAAAAAGHARANANDTKDMNIERLMAACAFGHVHVINVVSKPHQILGRNVTVVRDGIYQDQQQQQQRRDGEQGSQGSSIPSSESPFQSIPYCMSVSPVVSSTNAMELPTALADQEGKSSKRRKHHNSHRRNNRFSLVTHYVLQLVGLPPPSCGNKPGAEESLSSTSKSNSMQAKKANSSSEPPPHAGEVGNAPEEGEDIDDDSQSTDPKEAVSAIG